MADYALYEKPHYTDPLRPIRISRNAFGQPGPMFRSHWHEQLELLYMLSGRALFRLRSEPYAAEPGDLLVANSNELHEGEALEAGVSYYCLIIDTSVMRSSFPSEYEESRGSDPKPGFRTLIASQIRGDPLVKECLAEIRDEEEARQPGYELAVKSAVYRLLAHLVRRHGSGTLSARTYDARLRNLERLNPVIERMERHYDETLTVQEAARQANLSPYYFCRLFKESTGRTFTDYLSEVRMKQAELLLRETDLTVTEIAFRCGYNDLNYFSRTFKRIRGVSPSHLRRTSEEPGAGKGRGP